MALAAGDRRDGTGARRRFTIGFLLNDSLFDSYTHSLWEGAIRGAEALGVNLLCFVGRHAEQRVLLAQNQTLLSQINPGTVDGLLTINVNDAEVLRRIPAFGQLPCASIQPTAGVPAVLADNYGGLSAALEHLIDVHRRRRIAFVRGRLGDANADERHRAYVDVLTRRGLPRDPALVFQGNFEERDGAAAVRAFFDERGLTPDAIVAANDEMALGVLAALEARGRVVPRDLSVVGFDDIARAEVSAPPLTSLSQPLPAMAERALELVVRQLEGQPPSGNVTLPAELVLRRSCGCFPEAVLRAAAAPQGRRPTTKAAGTFGPAPTRRRLAASLERELQSLGLGLGSDWAAPLVDALAGELSGKAKGEMLPAVERLCLQVSARHLPVARLQELVSALRRLARPLLAARAAQLSAADDLWHQARVLIDEEAQRQIRADMLAEERREGALRRLSMALGSTFDVAGVTDLLEREAPLLGLSHCYLALHEGPERPAAASRLVLAYCDGARRALGAGGEVLAPGALVPPGLRPALDRYTLQVMPIFFSLDHNDELGYVVLGGPRPDGTGYETLCAQLGAALKGAFAFRERDANQRALELEVEVRRAAEDESRASAEKLVQSNLDLLERQQALTRENEERRRAEEAASRERDLLHTLMDNIPDLIFFKNDQGRFSRINRAQARALALEDPREAEGRTELDFLPEDFARESAEDEREIFRSGRPLIGKLQHESRSGRWYLVTKVPIHDAQGAVVSLVGVSHDITERRLAEDKLARDLDAFQEMVSAAARGDLTRRGPEGDDVIGQMARAVNGMLGRFATLLGEVRDAAFAVSTASAEILAASNQISKAAHYGRDHVHSTSSAVEEMAASMAQVSKNAESSETKANQVLEHVGRGDDAVNATYLGMERIDGAVGGAAERVRLLEARGREISEIIDLIEEISSQSKLLSLNAAIEAAHAGDAGRGFAVVADEVRRLADHSTQATKDVSRRVAGIRDETQAVLTAMENAMREVRGGRELSEQARGSLHGIRGLVEDSARISIEIAGASREQAQATRTVAEAMQTISNITVESAAGATESSKAVQDLVRLSEHLNEAISRFKL